MTDEEIQAEWAKIFGPKVVHTPEEEKPKNYCQCGAHAVYKNEKNYKDMHSYYCPLYTERGPK